MTDADERRLADLHARLLDPDDGVFARLSDLRRDVQEVRTWAAKHDTADAHQFSRIDARLDSLDNSRSRLKGWLLGVAAAGGIGGSLAGKLAEWLGT